MNAPAELRLVKQVAERRKRRARKLQSNPDGGLLEFVRYFWHVLEPETELVEGPAVEAICRHLEET